MLYQRKADAFVPDNQTKDSLILRLKNELFDLRQLEKEYINLNAQVENLQGKYELLLEERQRDQRDQRMKTAMDLSTIEDLRLELEAMNKKADLVNSETEQGVKTNNALGKMVQVKNKEIQQLKKQNSLLASRNQKKKAQITARFAQSKCIKQDKNRLQDLVLQCKQQFDQSILKAKQLQRQIKNKQNQNLRSQKRVYSTARAQQSLNQQLKVKGEQIRKQTSRLSSIEEMFDGMVQQLKELEQLGDKKKIQSDNVKMNYEQELRKNKDLNFKLSRTQNQLRGKQKQINDMIKKRNQGVVTHQKHTEYNRMVNMRLDRNLEIIYEYQGINKDLVSEIRAYCQVDEKAREILNRSVRMEDIINKAQKKIKASSSNLNHILRS